MPKQALFPIEYDEISLVDSGAAGGAHVLIFKRHASKVLKLNPVGNAPGIPPRTKKRKPSGSSTSSSTSSSSSSGSSSSRTSGTQGGGTTKPKKTKKPKTNPCNPKSSTGKKTGKSSQRAKNWNGSRHPRQQGGKFGQTSQQSKQKYGKGGTTKAKQVAECKRRHSKSRVKSVGVGSSRYKPANARAANARGLKAAQRAVRRRDRVTKNWKTDAQLRALVERKAAR